MSILDKKLYLADLSEQLDAFLPGAQARRVLEAAGLALDGYDLSALRPEDGGADDSDGLLRLFLDAKAIEGRSEKTIAHYHHVLGHLRRSVGLPYQKMTVHHLRSFLSSEKARGVSLKTLEGNRYVFSSFFGWAWKEELIPKNPTANLAPIKQAKVIRLPFSAVEVEKLKAAADSDRDLAIVCFLLSTGCRISEACALDVLDIDFRDRRATVTGKGNKQRVVYIDEVAALYLNRYLSGRNDASAALFVGKGSTRMTPGGIRAMLKRIEKRSGVENVHPHRFRRTLATNLINHGMAIQDVAAVLGHDQLDTTMTYVYVDQRNVEVAYRKYA